MQSNNEQATNSKIKLPLLSMPIFNALSSTNFEQEAMELLSLGKVRKYNGFSNHAKAFRKTPDIEVLVGILPCGQARSMKTL